MQEYIPPYKKIITCKSHRPTDQLTDRPGHRGVTLSKKVLKDSAAAAAVARGARRINLVPIKSVTLLDTLNNSLMDGSVSAYLHPPFFSPPPPIPRHLPLHTSPFFPYSPPLSPTAKNDL